jgi:hypothetical protein
MSAIGMKQGRDGEERSKALSGWKNPGALHSLAGKARCRSLLQRANEALC